MSRWSGSTIRRHARPEEDKVSHELAIEVMERDGWCVAAQITPEHECRLRLTIDHVPCRGRNAYGVRAPSTREHLVAVCLGASNENWPETHREDERVYLDHFYFDYHADGRCPALDDVRG